MDFGFFELQCMLQQMIVQFLKDVVLFECVCWIMEFEFGYDVEFMMQFGDQGLFGLLIVEEYGGFGFGLFDMVVVVQIFGVYSMLVNFYD